jgi:hypothetical protein
MHRILVMVVLLLPFVAGGCSWQANSASQAVTVNPLAWGSREPVVSPANTYGYVNGEPLDARTGH